MSEQQAGTALAPIDYFKQDLQGMAEDFSNALPAHITVDKFQRTLLTAISLKPEILTGCSKSSIMSSCLRAAADGLVLDGREAALVAYGSEAQYMPMVAGLKKLVRNSGEIAEWDIEVVKENDLFKRGAGDNPFITHEPASHNRGATIGAYSIVKFKAKPGEEAGKSREYMDLDELERVRKRSKKANGGPWVSDTDEMYKKTVARRHFKNLPKSTDKESQRLASAVERIDDDYDFAPAPVAQGRRAAAILSGATVTVNEAGAVVDAGGAVSDAEFVDVEHQPDVM